MSTTLPSNSPTGRARVAALAVGLAVILGTIGPASAAPPPGPPAGANKTVAAPKVSWTRGAIFFLTTSAAFAYIWYYGVFPRMLRKSNPSWPLDAWRLATAGAWTTTCLAGIFFDWPTRFMSSVVFMPIFGAGPLSAYFFVGIVLPLLEVIGLLVIWNFRRDESIRARL
jgi:hypothetical protein